MTMKRRVAFLVIALFSAVTLVSAAQTKKPAGRAPSAPAKKAPAKPPAEDGDASAPLAGKEPAEPAARDTGAGKGGGVVDQKTLDGGQRVFRFGEVEVEGRLKSPQIVYFLRRVRAEFAAGDLGHRSFMSELGETKNEPGF
ncbi:MAG: hypothetical protein KIS78_35985 [Labilithrix sp.]|nr:hypothetical protein [Labilithrix sp.]MCW5837848.1 hypothetical protein [Labilithrix sp.]